ncbi:hypothetical protein ACJMK2_015475, partial [Sinanodonta woodiana]
VKDLCNLAYFKSSSDVTFESYAILETNSDEASYKKSLGADIMKYCQIQANFAILYATTDCGEGVHDHIPSTRMSNIARSKYF